jgi:hypothetical protein
MNEISDKKNITIKERRGIYYISNRTAAYELTELVENFKVVKMLGASVGTYYELQSF